MLWPVCELLEWSEYVGIGILTGHFYYALSHARPCQLLGKLAHWTGRADKFSSMGIKVCWRHRSFIGMVFINSFMALRVGNLWPPSVS